MKALRGLLQPRHPVAAQSEGIVPINEQDRSPSQLIPHVDLPVLPAALDLGIWEKAVSEPDPEPKQEKVPFVPEIKLYGPAAKPVESRFPPELWSQIFMFASLTPRKDEYSRDGSTYNTMVCDQPPDRLDQTQEELWEAIQTRYRIIQVCRDWYSAGIRVLWSHLRINLAGKSSALDATYEKLCVAPALASCVIRFDAILPTACKPRLFYDFEKLLGRLPSLKIINVPLPFGLSIYHCCPDIVLLDSNYPLTVRRVQGMDFWRSARIMRLDCGTQSVERRPRGMVNFPRLEDLRIKDSNGCMLPYILKNWEIPAIRVLSIDGPPLSDYSEFLQTWCRRLEKLELSVGLPRVESEGVQMLALRTLYVDYDCRAWLELIKAPHLRRSGISGLPMPQTERPVDMVKLFPTVKELSFHGKPGTTLSYSELWTESIEKWREMGILVHD